MKKVFKIFSYFILVVIFLVIVLSVIAKLAENKIAGIALKKVSENIEAPVNIDEVSFNLLRKFPLATIELNNVILNEQLLAGSTTTKNSLDTIANIQKLFISVKSKPLLNGDFDIMKVEIDGAVVNYIVDTSGTTNIDFLLASSDTSEIADTAASKPLNLNLTDLTVKNIVCNYIDSSLKTTANVKIPELRVNAKLEGENILASAKGEFSLTDCSFENTNLNLMNKADISFDIDYENDSVSINDLIIDTDGAGINILGNVILGESIKTDIQFTGTNLILGELLKYAPAEVLHEAGIKDVSGIMGLDATVKGLYSETEMPKVDLNINFLNGKVITNDYPELKNVTFTGRLTNGILKNNQSTQANFSAFHFETDKSKFDFAFSVLDIDKPKYDIKAGLDINIEEFKSFIPDTLVNQVDGNIKASLTTKGELPDSIDETFVDYLMANSTAKIDISGINADLESGISLKNFSTVFNYKPNNFIIKGLNIEVPTYNLELKNTAFNTNFSGSVNDINGLRINVKNYHIETKGATISGFLKVRNLDNPIYNTKTKIKIALKETTSMLPDSMFSELDGNVVIDVSSKAQLKMDSIAEDAIKAAFKNSTVKVSLKNLIAISPDDPMYKIENLSGKIKLSHQAITIDDLGGKVAGIDFAVDSTKIENLYNSVIQNKPEKLLVDTRLSLGDIDYSMFAPFMLTDTTQEIADAELEQKKEPNPTNFTMEIKGAASVKSLTYDSILVSNISTLFNITDSVYIIDQFKFNAFNGSMNSSVRYELKPENKSVVETKHYIDKMDIKKLLADFNDFEDFHEPSIRSENLSGLFSTGLYTRLNMIGDSLIMKDVRVRGDIKLEEGGVYDYEPVSNLSKFTGIDELDNIKFKTLESKIFVFKNAIYVPETFISSTALNIKAYGMQSFGEDYEYHLEIKLSDILFGKTKKQKRKESKAGDDNYKDDRNMREIVAYSLDGKNKNGFDNKELQNKMKTKIKLNQNLLNLRFHPEMFNFDTKVYSTNSNKTINNQKD